MLSLSGRNVINGENTVQNDLNSDPHYSFGYKIEDPSTGDSKSQYEIRNGDVVKGKFWPTNYNFPVYSKTLPPEK